MPNGHTVPSQHVNKGLPENFREADVQKSAQYPLSSCEQSGVMYFCVASLQWTESATHRGDADVCLSQKKTPYSLLRGQVC